MVDVHFVHTPLDQVCTERVMCSFETSLAKKRPHLAKKRKSWQISDFVGEKKLHRAGIPPSPLLPEQQKGPLQGHAPGLTLVPGPGLTLILASGLTLIRVSPN